MRAPMAQAARRRCPRFATNRQQAALAAPPVRPRGALRCSQRLPNSTAMTRHDAADRDPNAELRSFEPLRVTLALGALLLGLLLGLH